MVLSNRKQKPEKESKKALLRWPILASGVALFSIAFLKGEIIDAVLTFAIGAFGGFLLDCVGVAKLKLWRYPKQEFLKIKYFGIVMPAWGVFGMAINLLWNWIYMPEVVTFIGITAGLFALHEFPNLKTRSWEYYVPMWAVMSGWLPLIVAFRALFIVLSLVS